jgi:hypothetical protein
MALTEIRRPKYQRHVALCKRCHRRGVGAESPAVHNGPTVFLRLAGQQRLADHQSCSADGGAGGRRRQVKSDRRGDRQPVGQNHRVGGPRGYAAEKMVKGRNGISWPIPLACRLA